MHGVRGRAHLPEGVVVDRIVVHRRKPFPLGHFPGLHRFGPRLVIELVYRCVVLIVLQSPIPCWAARAAVAATAVLAVRPVRVERLGCGSIQRGLPPRL